MVTSEINYDSGTIVDLENDSITPEVLLEGETAHDATGASITGTMRTVPDSAMLDGHPPSYYLPVVQLLDNSYWRIKKNIINQRGQTVYNGSGYTIDRWQCGNAAGKTEIVDGGIAFSATGSGTCYFTQFVPSEIAEKLSNTTKAVKLADGAIYAGATTTVYIPNGAVSFFQSSSGKWIYQIEVNPYSTVTLEWAALYEGTYTADTLPPYVPRPYAVELAECMLYWQKLHRIMVYTKGNEQWLDVFVNFPPMRVIPTVIIKSAELNGTPIDVSGMIAYCDGSKRGISSVQDTKGQFGVSAFQRVYLDIELNANM